MTRIIKQYNGPYSANTTIPLPAGTLFGISISQDDFMKEVHSSSPVEHPQLKDTNFTFKLNNELIQIGKTFIYQSGEPLGESKILSFPNGAPASVKINIVQPKNE